MKRLFISLILLAVMYSAQAQFRFGAEFSLYYIKSSGFHVLDTIVVDGYDANQGELFFTVFAEQTIKKNLELQAKLSVKPIYPSFAVYNSDASCLFCPVTKGTVLGITNLSLEFLPQVNIPLFKPIKTKVFFGTSLSFNFVKKEPDIHFNGKHEGVAEVINSLYTTVEPFTLAIVYGGSLEFKNIVASARVQLKSDYTKTYTAPNREYDFKNNYQLITFSVGYIFQTKKNKAKNQNKHLSL